MNDLGQFLTSQEIIIVYIIAAFAILICFIVYLVEKYNDKLRKRHNTKELNRLVEEIRDTVSPVSSNLVVENSLKQNVSDEPMLINSIDIDETVDLEEVVEEIQNIEEHDELQYTSIEPDQETAKLELEKLKKQLEEEQRDKAVIINSYEIDQERSAIISLDELMSKSQEMYESNEQTQYADEGNEPISIQDLELQVNRQVASYDEPFIIANVVPEEELLAGINEAFEEQPVEVLQMNDFATIKPETVNPVVLESHNKKFQCSPVISPIFGIERDPARDNAIALENTANYEKLDQEIRNSNEFYMTMNELQEKIE